MGECGSSVYNEIVVEPLTEDNKDSNEYWFKCVRSYLKSRDLWEVVEDGNGTFEEPSKDEKENFANWKRKDAAAMHILLISCGPQASSQIRVATKAKLAWKRLKEKYYRPPPPPPTDITTGKSVDYNVAALYKAICENNWSAAQEFFHKNPPNALLAILNHLGETPLHVAALFGHVHVVDELVRWVLPNELKIKDFNGYTPLASAARSGVDTRVAKCLVNKNRNIVQIPTRKMILPVTLAFVAGHKEMGRYLYSVTPLEVLKPQNGSLHGPQLLHACFTSGDLAVALDLLERCNELLFAKDNLKWGPIMGIATMSLVFPSGSQLVFWRRWIYNWLGLVGRFISNAYDNMLGEKELQELKLANAQADEIVRLLERATLTMVGTEKTDEEMDDIADAVFRAAREGNAEFVKRILRAHPHLIWLSSVSAPKWHTFLYAVAHRQAEVFNLIHGLRFKEALASYIDDDENSMLHVAGMLAPSSQLNRISGPAFQMQTELQWFKEVESLVPLGMKAYQNKKGMKPDDVFKESHKELRKEGEKWIKETSSSYSVVGALIVTIMFATAFTVPGGNDQVSGYPIFLEKKNMSFIIFLISDALSLFFSATSLLMFLGILTSRYAEEDFLKSLPTKLIMGLSTLFLSIATMMIAFSATIFLMLQHRLHSLTLLPIIILASIPITVFVLLQFPLLRQMVSSTYGQGIFRRNMEQWL